MLSRFLIFSKMLMLGCAVIIFQSCSKDDDPAVGKGEVSYEITDAASDNANIKGVFVTVTDIKVDGKSVGLTGKQTIDLSAYANGNTKLLGTSDLDAKSYNSITLVLDNKTDASGNAPGNYVLTTDDTKYELTGSTSETTEIVVNKSFDVAQNSSSTILLDFDLRKAIKHDNNASVQYQFVDNNNLSAAVRLVEKSQTGTIKGSYQENFTTNADMVVVYAYHKGEFDQSAESTADANGILFKDAVTSAKVNIGLTNNFSLNFMEPGEYELLFAAYSKNTTTNTLELNTLLASDLKIGGEAAEFIKVDINAEVSVSATIIGLL